jgi:surface carbohydrate biosynthesis protein (TIGR04326 family)
MRAPSRRAKKRDSPQTLLVITEFSPRFSEKQLGCLQIALQLMTERWEVWVKSHISHPIRIDLFRGLNVTERRGSLLELTANADAIFVGPMTSAAIEALASDAPVATFRDLDEVDWSPLRGIKGATRVSSPAELAQFMVSAAGRRNEVDPKELVNLSNSTANWYRLLKLEQR